MEVLKSQCGSHAAEGLVQDSHSPQGFSDSLGLGESLKRVPFWQVPTCWWNCWPASQHENHSFRAQENDIYSDSGMVKVFHIQYLTLTESWQGNRINPVLSGGPAAWSDWRLHLRFQQKDHNSDLLPTVTSTSSTTNCSLHAGQRTEKTVSLACSLEEKTCTYTCAQQSRLASGPWLWGPARTHLPPNAKIIKGQVNLLEVHKTSRMYLIHYWYSLINIILLFLAENIHLNKSP